MTAPLSHAVLESRAEPPNGMSCLMAMGVALAGRAARRLGYLHSALALEGRVQGLE